MIKGGLKDMKKTCTAVLLFLLCASPLFGDEVDNELTGAPGVLREHTRAMIQAGVESGDAMKMTKTMEQNRFQVENIIRSQEIVMGALAEGLPAGPVMRKAYEGLAKNAREQDVVNAMERTRARYSLAYRTARKVTESAVEKAQTGNAIAEGMAAGLTARDADRICDRLQTRDRDRTKDRTNALARESFMAAREMVRYRVPSDVASEAVCTALEKQYEAKDMEMLRSSFMKNARYGNAARLAREYASRIRGGMSSGELGSVGRGESGQSSGISAGAGAGNGSGAGAGSGSGAGGQGGSGNGGKAGSGNGSGGRQ